MTSTLNFNIPTSICESLKKCYPDKQFFIGIEIENYECYKSSDNFILCKETTSAGGTPPTTGGTPSNTNTPRPTTRESKYNKLNLSLRALDPTIQKEFEELYQELRDSNVLVAKLLRIQNYPNPDDEPERIVLFGRDDKDRNERFEVKKNEKVRKIDLDWLSAATSRGQVDK